MSCGRWLETPQMLGNKQGMIETPLMHFAFAVEDYESIKMSSAQKKEGPVEFPQKFTHAYQSALKIFSWLLFALVVVFFTARLSKAQLAQTCTISPSLVCEDVDASECANLLASANGTSDLSKPGFGSLPHECSPQSNGTLAARCPRSCGLCALVLADCHSLKIYDRGNCRVGEDVVGEVCSEDGHMTKEAYCTWLPTTSAAILEGSLRSWSSSELQTSRCQQSAVLSWHRCWSFGTKRKAEPEAVMCSMRQVRLSVQLLMFPDDCELSICMCAIWLKEFIMLMPCLDHRA